MNMSPTARARMLAAVSNQLGCAVELVRWDRHEKTGAEIPVFLVPDERRAAAAELGLRSA